MFGLYLITPDREPDALVSLYRRAFDGAGDTLQGRVGLQLRAPSLSRAQFAQAATELRDLTRELGVDLLLNGAPELAAAMGADGVQLPERGPSVARARELLGHDALVGASRHDLDGARRAAREGASFATLSPIRSVRGKGAAMGVEGFAAAASATELPLFALGGVGIRDVTPLREAGAAGIAVIRAVSDTADPADAVRSLLAELDRVAG